MGDAVLAHRFHEGYSSSGIPLVTVLLVSSLGANVVGKRIGVMRHTVRRCVRRAEQLGVMAALDDSPRPGKAPVITPEARAWVVSLASQKAKDLGVSARAVDHAQEQAQTAGHPCTATIVQGTVCKILARHEVKPHKVRYLSIESGSG